MVRHEVIWTALEGPGLEHARLEVTSERIRVDSVLIALGESGAARLRYRLVCDARWRVLEARIFLLDAPGRLLHLVADGAGHWETGAGRPLPDLDGCLDMDLSLTPLTNTLPIRRRDLRPGESAEVAMAYIDAPTLQFSRTRQRYTCLESGPTGGRYRFEALDGAFTAEITTDVHGLVVEYPGLFSRRWYAEV